VVFVAGNHDYYGADTSGLRAALAKIDDLISFEPGCQTDPLLLGPDVFLCGSGGWGDARAGTATDPVMPLPDETLIADLGARKLAIRLGQFGCLSARHLLRQLNKIPPAAQRVIILTHAALAQEFLSLRQRGLLIVSGTDALVKKHPEARGKLLPGIVSLFAERLERGPRLKDDDAVLHEDIELPIFESESGSVHAGKIPSG
jgi:hypothetical protein